MAEAGGSGLKGPGEGVDLVRYVQERAALVARAAEELVAGTKLLGQLAPIKAFEGGENGDDSAYRAKEQEMSFLWAKTAEQESTIAQLKAELAQSYEANRRLKAELAKLEEAFKAKFGEILQASGSAPPPSPASPTTPSAPKLPGATAPPQPLPRKTRPGSVATWAPPDKSLGLGPRKLELKLTVLGAEEVGKTALCVHYVAGHFLDSYEATVEDTYMRHAVIAGSKATVEVVDTGGLPDYVDKIDLDDHIRTSDGLLLVYSVTDRSSFVRMQNLAERVKRVRGGQPSPMVVVGNKADVPEEDPQERKVSEREGRIVSERLDSPYIEVSARKQDQAERVFGEAVMQVWKAAATAKR